jgi:hypothetical protein
MEITGAGLNRRHADAARRRGDSNYAKWGDAR